MGDPLELAALKQVMRDSKRATPLLVGSIKSHVSVDIEAQSFDTESDQTHRSGISRVPRGSRV